jgi:hypothetical protein
MTLISVNNKQLVTPNFTTSSEVVTVLANYVSAITNVRYTTLLKLMYLDNRVVLYVHYYRNNNDYELEVITDLPYDTYLYEELISIYNKYKECVIDYV